LLCCAWPAFDQAELPGITLYWLITYRYRLTHFFV
jgi:hypothetical protein